MRDGKRLYLIDGTSYVYRAFYAIKGGLHTSGGLPTNAVYGFAQMLIRILKEEKPDYLAIAFDTPEPTFRHEEYREYKANRPPAPDDLVLQWPYIYRLVKAFDIPTVYMPGYEADDIIGTLARKAEGEGYEVTILSGDKDLFQLVTPGVQLLDTLKDKVYDEGAIREKFGVEPRQLTEVFGLMGDKIDNVPGVPGIGEKTAVELIKEFHDIENLLHRVDEVKKERVRNSLLEFSEQARLSRRLVTVKTDAPVDLDVVKLEWGRIDREGAVQLFRELEFTRLLNDFVSGSKTESARYKVLLDEGELLALRERLWDAPVIAVDLETTHQEPMRASLVGISLALIEGEAFYIPVGHDYLGAPQQLGKKVVLETLRPVLQDESIKKCGQNIKYDMIVLEREGVSLKGVAFDTMVASYLLNPSKRNHNLADIALDHLSYKIITYSDVAGSGAKQKGFNEVAVEAAGEYSCEDADITLKLSHLLGPKLGELALDGLFYEVELPLIEVLAALEMNGVKLDTDLLAELSLHLEKELQISMRRVYEIAGREFNINSPHQLREVLFDELKLKPMKRTKTGPSTDVSVLERLASEHALPAEILEYRQLAKLKSTYVDALPKLVNPDTGRIHTSFNQTVTATGRLSSSDPNLQNIPIRSELGREIRKAFVAEPGHLVLSADYSQIELRILAHLAKDPALIRSFLNQEDIHARTASQVFGVPLDKVSPDQRRMAKAVNFGVLYGMSYFGLARELHISESKAKEFIDNYFGVYSKVKEFIEEIVAKAHEDGYVTTILNRRRYIPELKDKNHNVRSNSERIAINTPIQGSAADMIKLAMINCQRRLRREGLKSKMVLQVHDELVFEVPLKEEVALKSLVKEEMEGVFKLDVPIVVDVHTGLNWNDAH